MHKYQQKIWTKQSPRDKMIRNRTFGVTPGCIPDPKKGYKRFERWFKRPRKAISCIGEYEGLRLGGICVRVYIEVAKIQHSKKKIAQSKVAVL
jgi:hypothetical protein